MTLSRRLLEYVVISIFCIGFVFLYVHCVHEKTVAIDNVNKAFDKLNHYGLFLKLMDRLIPDGLLSVLEHWLNISATCVR